MQVIASDDIAVKNYIDHEVTDRSVVINATHGKVTLTSYAKNSVEVVFKSADHQFNANDLPSYAIKESANTEKLVVTESKNSLTIKTGTLKAVVNKSPFSLSYFQDSNLLLKEKGYFTSVVKEEEKLIPVQGFRFKLTDTEKLIGGGERVVGMDRRGHRLPLYNKAHYGYETYSEQMNYGLPAVLSSNKYIILFDNSAKGWMDLGKTHQNIMQFEAVSGRTAYIVFSGDSYPELIQNYVEVTGKQPMPPRWALGNFASRFGYRTETEVRDVVKKFKEADVPLDALVLDLYWFGKDIKGHMGNLDWDKEAFPNPNGMIADLQEQGVNTVLITEPFVLTGAKKWKEAEKANALMVDEQGNPKTFDFYFGNTGLIDVFNDDGINWFNQIYKTLHKQGIKGWWGDLGEPEVHPSDGDHRLNDGSLVSADDIHNVYGHQWAKMLSDNLLEIAPDERPFILMRSGFAGSQRYGMIPWTGDVNRSWGGLQPQVELSLQMGLLGLGYTHSDLGGFAGGESFNKELYIRWLQYGVFQPVYRPHAQDHIASEVVFHDQETQDILRKFIKLRYQLLPYNYTLAYENSTTGMPFMRPMFFDNENDLTHFDNTNGYFWGDSFFVNPIVEADIKEVQIDLPEGVWFDFFEGQRYIGNQSVSLSTSLNNIPVFVKAGAFIPMIDDISSTQSYSSEKLNLHFYADKSVKESTGQMYEDNGELYQAHEKNQFELLKFVSKRSDEALKISLVRSGKTYREMPKTRKIDLVIHHLQERPNKIEINGKKVNSFNWNVKSKRLSVEFDWHHEPLDVLIK